jgi:hypothetical protein
MPKIWSKEYLKKGTFFFARNVQFTSSEFKNDKKIYSIETSLSKIKNLCANKIHKLNLAEKG